jgi:hypothetical protein
VLNFPRAENWKLSKLRSLLWSYDPAAIPPRSELFSKIFSMQCVSLTVRRLDGSEQEKIDFSCQVVQVNLAFAERYLFSKLSDMRMFQGSETTPRVSGIARNDQRFGVFRVEQF